MESLRGILSLAVLLVLSSSPAGALGGSVHRDFVLREHVEKAITRVKGVLNSTRRPQYPPDVPHVYDDKFLLVEFATKAAAAGTAQLLDGLAGEPGWWDENQATLRRWSQAGWPITLRFLACETCDFLRTEERDLDSGTKTVSESMGGWVTSTAKTVTTIQEHFWQFNGTWQLSVQPMSRESEGILLQRTTGLYTIKTTTALNVDAEPPKPKVTCANDFTMDLSWLVARAGSKGIDFTVNRSDDKQCRTPRRNREVNEAVEFFNNLDHFSRRGKNYFNEVLFPVQKVGKLDLGAIHKAALDVSEPVFALFTLDSAEAHQRPVLASNFAAVLAEHSHSLQANLAKLKLVFPEDDGLITSASASLAMVLLRARQLFREFSYVVNGIEHMLYGQLADAIGKELSSADFSEYMDFHHAKLFQHELRPSRFSYAVRRPGQSPEGVVSLETSPLCRNVNSKNCQQGTLPIQTVPARRTAGRPMSLALNAATDVEFLGERFLHSIVLHQFGSEPTQQLSLMARARQFSSFVLLTGKVLSADRFEPTAALIIKDKDDLTLPLILESIPSPKEFRDAIESLSPEQQRFARAFREMQLSSTLFGILVVQIKPQLEEVLNLPPNSLTKEIQLTQDLMDLFITYQVPSDLLSYDDAADQQNVSKLHAVQEHVTALLATIAAAREKDMKAEREKAESYRLRHPESCASGNCNDGTEGAFRKGTPSSDIGFASLGSSLSLRSYSRLGTSIDLSNDYMMRESRPESSAVSPSMNTYFAAVPESTQSTQPAIAMRKSVKKGAEARTPVDEPHVPELPSQQRVLQGQSGHSEAGVGEGEVEPDYSALPGLLDRQFELLDVEGTLRPTKVSPAAVWSKKENPFPWLTEERSLVDSDQEQERNRAFDLLDALTRSGAMQLRHASLHIILAATHAFDKTLVDSIVQGNVNPIEKVERSMLIMTSTLHQRTAESVLAPSQLARVRAASPGLFAAEAGNVSTATGAA